MYLVDKNRKLVVLTTCVAVVAIGAALFGAAKLGKNFLYEQWEQRTAAAADQQWRAELAYETYPTTGSIDSALGVALQEYIGWGCNPSTSTEINLTIAADGGYLTFDSADGRVRTFRGARSAVVEFDAGDSASSHGIMSGVVNRDQPFVLDAEGMSASRLRFSERDWGAVHTVTLCRTVEMPSGVTVTRDGYQSGFSSLVDDNLMCEPWQRYYQLVVGGTVTTNVGTVWARRLDNGVVVIDAGSRFMSQATSGLVNGHVQFTVPYAYGNSRAIFWPDDWPEGIEQIGLCA